jgi:hypothetical protein
MSEIRKTVITVLSFGGKKDGNKRIDLGDKIDSAKATLPKFLTLFIAFHL